MMKWFKRKKKTEQEQSPPPELTALPLEEESFLGEQPPRTQWTQELDTPVEPAEPTTPPQSIVPDPADSSSQPHGSHQSDPSCMSYTSESPDPLGSPDTPSAEDAPDHPGEPQQKRRFFQRLRERMHKTRENFTKRVDRLVLGKKTIDVDLLDDLEEVLITSDLGVRTTQLLLQRVADKIKRKELSDPAKLQEQLRGEIEAILAIPAAAPLDFTVEHPFVVMIVGVNGVGKTTTIGKLAHLLKSDGKKVMLGACDTFRAAAVEQLVLWGERADVPVIRQKSGSDPSAVAFDAMDAALSRDVDVLLLDTAGRMHTKVNLMEELKKVHRTVIKKMPSAPHEIWLVLDASTGQNALSQARLFKEAIGITGLILTKLDGTAKGGIVVAISEELQLPVRYIGIGESMDDLRPFDAEEFARAIF